jgi:hypothetical protein
MKSIKKIILIVFTFLVSTIFSLNVNAKTTDAIYYAAQDYSSVISGK